MTSGRVFLIGCTMIAAAIIIHAFVARLPKYQVSYVAPGILARVDTRTGALDFCGNTETILEAFLPKKIAELRAAGFTDAEIDKWSQTQIASADQTHCFTLNAGH